MAAGATRDGPRQTPHAHRSPDLRDRPHAPHGGERQREVAELASTFNAMVDRLEASFRTQRKLLDETGHDLRTPLTIIRGHLELLGDDPDERRETLLLVRD